MRQSLFLNEVAGIRPETLFKKRLRRRHFPMNCAKFLRTPILQNTSGGYFSPCPYHTSNEAFFKDFVSEYEQIALEIPGKQA